MACEKGKIGEWFVKHKKIRMTVEDPPFEDVFPIEKGGFSSLPC